MSPGGWWRRLTRGERRLEHRPEWLRCAGGDFADSIMSVPVTDRHHAKQGRSIGRLVLRQGEEQLVVYLKRHFTASWWRRVLAVFWPGRGWSAAWGEWRRLHWAKQHGLPVPTPVAVGEFIGPGLRLQSFLAVQELTGRLPLHEAIPRAAAELADLEFEAWKRAISAQAAKWTRALHHRRRFHKDLYLCHFYVRPPEPGRRSVSAVHMIDFHRLGHHPLTGWFWGIKDLAQLLYSTDVTGLSNRDRLRFLYQYLGRRKLGRSGRRLLWFVLAKARLYQRKHDKDQARRVGWVEQSDAHHHQLDAHGGPRGARPTLQPDQSIRPPVHQGTPK